MQKLHMAELYIHLITSQAMFPLILSFNEEIKVVGAKEESSKVLKYSENICDYLTGLGRPIPGSIRCWPPPWNIVQWISLSSSTAPDPEEDVHNW